MPAMDPEIALSDFQPPKIRWRNGSISFYPLDSPHSIHHGKPMTLGLSKLEKFEGRWSWNEKTLEANIKAVKPNYNVQKPRTWPLIELSLIEKSDNCKYTGSGALPRSVVYEQIIVDRYLDAHPGMLENRKRAEAREAEAKATEVKKENKRQFMEELDADIAMDLVNLKNLKPRAEHQDTKDVKHIKIKQDKDPNSSKRVSERTNADQDKKDSKSVSLSRIANVKIEKKKDSSKTMTASGTKHIKRKQGQNSNAKLPEKKVTNVRNVRTRSHGMFSTTA